MNSFIRGKRYEYNSQPLRITEKAIVSHVSVFHLTLHLKFVVICLVFSLMRRRNSASGSGSSGGKTVILDDVVLEIRMVEYLDIFVSLIFFF